jgi:transposase
MPVPSLPSAGCPGCAERDAVIEAQAAAISELQARVERLERLVSRNSGNSSMPPSADDLPGRTPPRQQPVGGKRNQGKQPGGPGSHLAWSECPGERVPHFPAGVCECGAALDGASDLGVVASHRQIEIPLVSAPVVQHDLHASE